MEYVLRMDVHKNRRIILDFEIFFAQNFLHKNQLNKALQRLCFYSLAWLVVLCKYTSDKTRINRILHIHYQCNPMYPLLFLFLVC